MAILADAVDLTRSSHPI